MIRPNDGLRRTAITRRCVRAIRSLSSWLGMVERFDGTFISRDHWYQCTPAGIEAARKSFRKFRLPKSKRRYQAFLDLRDVLPDLTFHEYLTTPDFAESRAEA